MNDLTRPIIGIENRTAQEVFDIMCDRLRAASITPPAPETSEPVAWVTKDILAAMKRGERAVPGWKPSADFCIPLYAATPPAPERSKEEVGQNERLNLHKKVLGMIRDKQRYAGAILDGRELHVIAEALLDRAIETEKAALEPASLAKPREQG